MHVVRVCKKCGFIRVFDSDSEKTCPACQAEMTDTNLDWESFCHMTKEEQREYCNVFLGDIKISKEMTLKRLEYEADFKARIKREHAELRGESVGVNKAKCPYCNSTNTNKIGTGGRLLSTLTFGIAGSKIGKQWHCNNCKSDF